jgi:hypothetical protein
MWHPIGNMEYPIAIYVNQACFNELSATCSPKLQIIFEISLTEKCILLYLKRPQGHKH